MPKVEGARLDEGDQAAGDSAAASHGPRQVDEIVQLALASARLLHDQRERPYAALPAGSHPRLISLEGKQGRRWLQRLYWEKHNAVPAPHAVAAAHDTVAGQAVLDGPFEDVFVRHAFRGGAVFLDLGDDAARAVRISRDGWEVIEDPPVLFRRPRAATALPEPERGGRLDHLRRFINTAGDEDFLLLLAWIVSTLMPRGPYPALVLQGEAGAAKSTAAEMLKSLVDPAKPLLRALPRTERDLAVAAANGHVLAYDNLSGLSSWMSDALCRVSTGGGLGTRELYSDDEEHVFEIQRSVILNGLDGVATRQDLIDRSVIVGLPVIPETRRKEKEGLWREFEQSRPRLLGAILDAAVLALRDRERVRLDRLPRMADFARWTVAAESAFGCPPGAFLAAYSDNRRTALVNSLDASPLVGAIEKFLTTLAPSEGDVWEFSATPTELFGQLEGRVAPEVRHRRNWPGSPQAMSRSLTLLAPALREEGIEVVIGGHAGRGAEKHRVITLRRDPSLRGRGDAGDGSASE